MKRKFISYSFIYFVGLIFSVLSAQTTSKPTTSNEGMWLPDAVPTHVYFKMRLEGCDLSRSDIYDESTGSFKDGVIRINDGQCTGAIISEKSLMLTNYHCIYDQLVNALADQPDILSEGYWAEDQTKEIHLKGLTAAFLVASKRVTEIVVPKGNFDEEDQIQVRIDRLIQETEKNQDVQAQVLDMFKGSEYYLYTYKVFKDVRLVGTPNAELGRFGYEKDAWKWPRHTMDFALLRIYGNDKGEPSSYSPFNVPVRPGFHFPLGTEGTQSGDFAMMIGYPGQTQRFQSAAHIEQLLVNSYPDISHLLELKAKQIKQELARNHSETLSNELADLKNTISYYNGQIEVIRKKKIIEEQRAFEQQFEHWAANNTTLQNRELYVGVLDEMEKLIEAFQPIDHFVNYFYRGLLNPQAIAWSLPFLLRVKPILKSTRDQSLIRKSLIGIEYELENHFDQFLIDLDKATLASAMASFYKQVPREYHPPVLRTILSHKTTKKGVEVEEKFAGWVEYAYSKSILTDKERFLDFIQKPELKRVEKDPLFEFVEALVNYYRTEIAWREVKFETQLNALQRKYILGMRQMLPEKVFYPDANSSMRLSVGTIKGLATQENPSAFSYYRGMLEKVQRGKEGYGLPNDLTQQDIDKNLAICFQSTHDISAGNSGSPMINCKGEIIGLAYDGNWGSITSDIKFNAEENRTISVDIRGILQMIKSFSKDNQLIEELNLKD